jgi:hypothetical protein
MLLKTKACESPQTGNGLRLAMVLRRECSQAANAPMLRITPSCECPQTGNVPRLQMAINWQCPQVKRLYNLVTKPQDVISLFSPSPVIVTHQLSKKSRVCDSLSIDTYW